MSDQRGDHPLPLGGAVLLGRAADALLAAGGPAHIPTRPMPFMGCRP